MSLRRPIEPKTYQLRHIRLHTVPNFDVGGGCDPYFDVRLGDGKQMMFDWKKVCIELTASSPLPSLVTFARNCPPFPLFAGNEGQS